jgi:hypothetical protein
VRNHSSKPKRSRDANQLAKAIVDLATGQAPVEPEPTVKVVAAEPTTDPIREAAKALGRRGGLKGGKARAERLTAEQRIEIAKKAARKRWGQS